MFKFDKQRIIVYKLEKGNKMIQFEYTKANGEETLRVGILVKAPEKNYLVMDLSECDQRERNIIEQQYAEMQAKIKAIQKEYNFDIYFKSFKPEGISDLKSCE